MRTLFGAAIVILWSTLAIADEPAAPRPKVLGHYTTTFLTDADHKSRAFNVQLAAEAIDNKTIVGGATFSFNDAVGERTASFGYAKAVVLRDGMIAEGTGGGACQVASTLYTAAMLAGLEVIARAPHTRPSAYIRMGFDATVAYPAIDLKLKNASKLPITIRAHAAKGSLDIAFESPSERQDITLSSEIVDRQPFTRTIEHDKSITDDNAHVKAYGIPGYRVRREREIKLVDGSVQRDVRFDLYAPINEVIRVSPSFDESRLSKRPIENEEDEQRAAAATAGPTLFVHDPAAIRPVLVQLRPSTLVTIDNSH